MDPDIQAKAVLLVNSDTGEVYYSKNPDGLVYPASTTKIMTCLLAIEAYERGEIALDEPIMASYTSHNDLSLDGSTQNIIPSEIMPFKDLLYCSLVASANEAGNILGERVAGGDIYDFIDMMNERAEELGCTGTHFSNTHGLHNPNHYTTARDLYLIVEEALKHPLFVDICNTVSIEIPPTNISDTRYLTTTNHLISPYKVSYYYPYASGVKTGHTDESGRCLVSTASKDGINLIAIVMGASTFTDSEGIVYNASFTETKRLYEWAFSSYSNRLLVSTDELVREVAIKLGSGVDSIIVRPEENISALLPADVEDSDITREIVIYNERDGVHLNAPISAGQVIGEITVSYEGKILGTTKLVSISSVDQSRYEYVKSIIFDSFKKPIAKVIVAVVIIAIILYIFFMINGRKRRRRRYNKTVSKNYIGRRRR
jgi:D-alanyl-D-alanine carboxypeptidase (penicillin-binding protein 5/6)